MAEYIERDKAIDELRQYIVDQKKAISDHPDDIEKFNDGIDTAISVLSTLPTADVQPVVHGRWINTMPDVEYKSFCQVKCSICGSIEAYGNFCRNCGADMRGE